MGRAHVSVLALNSSRSAESAAVRPLRFHSRTRAAQVSRVAIRAAYSRGDELLRRHAARGARPRCRRRMAPRRHGGEARWLCSGFTIPAVDITPPGACVAEQRLVRCRRLAPSRTIGCLREWRCSGRSLRWLPSTRATSAIPGRPRARRRLAAPCRDRPSCSARGVRLNLKPERRHHLGIRGGAACAAAAARQQQGECGQHVLHRSSIYHLQRWEPARARAAPPRC